MKCLLLNTSFRAVLQTKGSISAMIQFTMSSFESQWNTQVFVNLTGYSQKGVCDIAECRFWRKLNFNFFNAHSLILNPDIKMKCCHLACFLMLSKYVLFLKVGLSENSQMQNSSHAFPFPVVTQKQLRIGQDCILFLCSKQAFLCITNQLRLSL